jgi:hypothetical protein
LKRGLFVVYTLLFVKGDHPLGDESLRIAREIDGFLPGFIGSAEKNGCNAFRPGPQFEAMTARFEAERGPDPQEIDFDAALTTGERRLLHERLGKRRGFQTLSPGGRCNGEFPLLVAPTAFVDAALVAGFERFQIVFEVIEETHIHQIRRTR